LYWSASGITSCSQNHCATLVSGRLVGVSALYSSSLGAPVPFHEKSKRPNRSGSSRCHESQISASASSGRR
jgi:hypothetical protein